MRTRKELSKHTYLRILPPVGHVSLIESKITFGNRKGTNVVHLNSHVQVAREKENRKYYNWTFYNYNAPANFLIVTLQTNQMNNNAAGFLYLVMKGPGNIACGAD